MTLSERWSIKTPLERFIAVWGLCVMTLVGAFFGLMVVAIVGALIVMFG